MGAPYVGEVGLAGEIRGLGTLNAESLVFVFGFSAEGGSVRESWGAP